MIKCIAIDDELPALEVMRFYIEKIPELRLCGTFQNPIEGLKAVKEERATLVFLDIQMQELSGLDVKNILDDGVKVIFCTAHSEFAVEGFNLNAVDYLLKPISFERFSKAVAKVLAMENTTKNDDFIFVKTEQKGKFIKISFTELSHVEALGNYVIFHKSSDKTTAYITLKELENALPKNFMRIHKSYIVNLEKVISVENGFAVVQALSQTFRIPIGANYKDQFLENINRNLL